MPLNTEVSLLSTDPQIFWRLYADPNLTSLDLQDKYFYIFPYNNIFTNFSSKNQHVTSPFINKQIIGRN